VAKLIVFGAGDIARLAHFYFSRDSVHEVVAFTVDPAYQTADSFLNLPLVPCDTIQRLYPPDTHSAFVALSYSRMNAVRAEKYDYMRALGYRLVSYVSSRCSYLSQYDPGDNCFILEDNTVQPYVRIGNDVTLWSGNHIGHDSTIGDHCFISSHVVVSGHVEIGESCFIGVNATLRNSIAIGSHTLIGAGAVVMKNTPPRSVYLGARAERFSKSSDQVEL
jgi:sugar O-acyltransferase (sialic acid O-acetyltransferase NeuD family)